MYICTQIVAQCYKLGPSALPPLQYGALIQMGTCLEYCLSNSHNPKLPLLSSLLYSFRYTHYLFQTCTFPFHCYFFFLIRLFHNEEFDHVPLGFCKSSLPFASTNKLAVHYTQGKSDDKLIHVPINSQWLSIHQRERERESRKILYALKKIIYIVVGRVHGLQKLMSEGRQTICMAGVNSIMHLQVRILFNLFNPTLFLFLHFIIDFVE